MIYLHQTNAERWVLLVSMTPFTSIRGQRQQKISLTLDGNKNREHDNDNGASDQHDLRNSSLYLPFVTHLA